MRQWKRKLGCKHVPLSFLCYDYSCDNLMPYHCNIEWTDVVDSNVLL